MKRPRRRLIFYRRLSNSHFTRGVQQMVADKEISAHSVTGVVIYVKKRRTTDHAKVCALTSGISLKETI